MTQVAVRALVQQWARCSHCGTTALDIGVAIP